MSTVVTTGPNSLVDPQGQRLADFANGQIL
jgi:hypothetical protein